MVKFRRLLVCGLLATFLFCGAHLVYSATIGKTTRHPDLLTAVKWVFDETNRSEEIQADQEQRNLINEKKLRVSRALLDHKITLAEAIQEFRRIHHGVVDPLMPGVNDEDRLGRNVIRWVRIDTNLPENSGDEIIKRLENELKDHLAHQNQDDLLHPTPVIY